ncbi:MAG: 4-hydroxythreonine-4-phosphate dehydrogenase PdxA [Woeseiaceae bacterium]|nr:4-hydroxythreonine-4-phosphate dehydrogenase PdxA [Woeseiaceae bacterium]
MTSASQPLAVTAGDPAGIGPDLCIALGADGRLDGAVVIGDKRTLRERAETLGIEFALDVVDLPFPEPVTAGQPNPANAPVLLDGLKAAVEGCREGRYAGLVTAPLAKHVVSDAGVPFTGHTEYLAELTDTPLPVMLLVADDLRVALASTHLALRDVPDYLTRERLAAVLDVLHADLRGRFGIDDPEIVVCGLNPHAGENGLLGDEDREIIAPVVKAFASSGARVRGPLPADTAFTPAAGPRDAVLAMYHDQGLPVIKFAGFGHAVNVTLGLPIIRTSVDHGTAFDLAGTGRADAGSLGAAIELARELASRA